MEYLQNLVLDFINNKPLMALGIGMVLVSAISSLSFSRVRVKTNQRISLVMFLMGLVFILMDFPTEKKSNKGIVNAKSDTKDEAKEQIQKYKEQEVKKVMEDFYEALARKDAESVESFFAPKVEKYLDKSNLNAYRIKKDLMIAWKKTKAETYQINWKTWKYKIDAEGNHLIQVDVQHTTQPTQGEEFDETLQLEIRLNKDLKIYFLA